MISRVNQMLRYISEGELDVIYHGLLNKIYERVFDAVRIVAVFNLSTEEPEQGTVRLVQDPNQQGVNFAVTTKDTIQISRDEPFSSVDLVLAFPSLAQETTVAFKFKTINGRIKEKEREIHTEDYYGSWANIPIYEEIDTRAQEVTITISTPEEIEQPSGEIIKRMLNKNRNQSTHYIPERPQLGPPTVNTREELPPILLLSIDSLRYDQLDQLQPLLAELGDHATIPQEPRTQGYWTAPSHASMFTGVHPGIHGYGYHGMTKGVPNPFDSSLETISTLLCKHGYKCSSAVSYGQLRPQFGFGRGFHRYHYKGMSDWINRENDAQSVADQIVSWIRRDSNRNQTPFYFGHVFDPHIPYIPPPEETAKNIDLPAVKEFTDKMCQPYDMNNDDRIFNPKPEIDDETSDLVWDYYQTSVNYTAIEIARILRKLKQESLFGDSLIIITGDHGEEWGESGYYGHHGLYDRSIRPFMAIKPPSHVEWKIPDEVDTIDFLPTIADLIGTEIPTQCQGRSLQESSADKSGPRIVEMFAQKRYHISVESGGKKAIYTYPGNHPDRPSKEQIEVGPDHAEYHRMADIRDGDYTGIEIPSGNQREIEDTISDFVTSDSNNIAEYSTRHVTATDRETRKQLEYLGYK